MPSLKLLCSMAPAAFLLIAPLPAHARETQAEKAAGLMAFRAVLVGLEDEDFRGTSMQKDRLRQNLERASKNFGAAEQSKWRKSLVALESANANDTSYIAATAFRDALIQVSQIELSPALTPDVGLAATIYQEQCSACHGITGGADGVLVPKMNPKPQTFASLKDSKGSPFRYLNVLRVGRPGTVMPSYKDKQALEVSWALAFYVAALPHGGAVNLDDKALGTAMGIDTWKRLLSKGLSLSMLARSSDAALLDWLTTAAAVDPKKSTDALRLLRTAAPFCRTVPRT